ncbi:MAG: hypothetical protein GC168_13725 [Candidatus Hydrogenedens sp.]|nr:hypothetical protein [Candidatus Hydrogenedens sp.]
MQQWIAAALISAGLYLGAAAQAEEAATAPDKESEAFAPAQHGPFKDVTREQWIAIAKKRVDEAIERLKLSDEQVAAIKPIVFEQVDKMRELSASLEEAATGMERMRGMRGLGELREETERRVDAELTEEQRAIAKVMREERREKMQEAVSLWRGGDEDALRDFLFPELKEESEAPQPESSAGN